MSEVLRRTVFIDDSDGIVRFHDWAVVTMESGTYMEPFVEPASKWNRNCVGGFVNFNATDSMCRIDQIHRMNLDKGNLIYGDGSIGGRLMPRTGR